MAAKLSRSNHIHSGTETDHAGRPLTKAVNTGWAPGTSHTASSILTLWGMDSELGSAQTDRYVLSMTYSDERANGLHLGNGGFWLVTKDANGNWVKAVNMNFGGKQKFVREPWTGSYEVGTYGIDTATRTAWAVINFNGDSAVALD